MAKRRNYTFEFKLRLVLEIVQGHGSLRTVSQNAGVNRRTLTHWVNLYNIHGEEALKWKKVYNRSIEQKIDLVLAYRESNLTLSQAAAQFGLVGADALTTWNNLMKDDKQLTANQFKKKIEASSKSLNNKDYSTLEKEIESKLQELKYLSKEDLINTLRETLAEVAYLKKVKGLNSIKITRKDKVNIIQELRLKFPLKVLLKIANIPYSSFYYHLKNKDGFLCKHKALVKQIQEIYHAHRGRYGYRRITLTINKIRKEKNQKQVNHKTVLKILKELGLKSFTRLKKYNSYKGVKNKAVDNILNREFQAQAPNEKWATDVTEFKVNGDKIFLSPIIDLFNGEIISYSLTKSPSVSAINNMLKKAYKVLSKKDRVILHSDQGWQYTMDNYKLALRKNNIIQSMSRKGNCYDNAIIENFFGVIKSELFYVNKFKDIADLESEIHKYIKYYNKERIRLNLNGLTPIEFRKEYLKNII